MQLQEIISYTPDHENRHNLRLLETTELHISSLMMLHASDNKWGWIGISKANKRTVLSEHISVDRSTYRLVIPDFGVPDKYRHM